MSFELSQTMMINNIRELQWGVGAQVGFTYFDSCMGLLGRQGNNVIGVHLVMATTDFFDEEAAALAASVVMRCNEVAAIGNVDLWEQSVPEPFQAMVRLIGAAWNPMRDRGSGNYGGRVQGGRIQYRFNGAWYNN